MSINCILFPNPTYLNTNYTIIAIKSESTLPCHHSPVLLDPWSRPIISSKRGLEATIKVNNWRNCFAKQPNRFVGPTIVYILSACHIIPWPNPPPHHIPQYWRQRRFVFYLVGLLSCYQWYRRPAQHITANNDVEYRYHLEGVLITMVDGFGLRYLRDRDVQNGVYRHVQLLCMLLAIC